jgi:hypothetical protein
MLTINVVLDEERVLAFVELYNSSANGGAHITQDMLFQNAELQKAIAEDMVDAWAGQLADAEDERRDIEQGDIDDEDFTDAVTAYELYSEFFS